MIPKGDKNFFRELTNRVKLFHCKGWGSKCMVFHIPHGGDVYKILPELLQILVFLNFLFMVTFCFFVFEKTKLMCAHRIKQRIFEL